MEERRVVMSIMGRGDEEDEEKVELLTEGTCTKDGDALILKYEESELSGLEGSTTVFTVEHGRVIMERQGIFSSYCVLEEGKKFEGSYDTPVGSMRMGVLPLRGNAVPRMPRSGGSAIRWAAQVAGMVRGSTPNTFHACGSIKLSERYAP